MVTDIVYVSVFVPFIIFYNLVHWILNSFTLMQFRGNNNNNNNNKKKKKKKKK